MEAKFRTKKLYVNSGKKTLVLRNVYKLNDKKSKEEMDLYWSESNIQKCLNYNELQAQSV